MADRFVGHIPMSGMLRRDAGGVNTPDGVTGKAVSRRPSGLGHEGRPRHRENRGRTSFAMRRMVPSLSGAIG